MERIDGKKIETPYLYQSAAIDLSAGSATIDAVFAPIAMTLEAVYYVVVEALEANIASAIYIGKADGDGNNDDTDYHVLGTADASGLLETARAVGYTKKLSIAKTGVDAGDLITITHKQDGDKTGIIRVILVYSF
ncbi:MAG: hypothetical protein ABIJ26_04790 [Candidatus Margulisiibacteriota bacterium]